MPPVAILCVFDKVLLQAGQNTLHETRKRGNASKLTFEGHRMVEIDYFSMSHSTDGCGRVRPEAAALHSADVIPLVYSP